MKTVTRGVNRPPRPGRGERGSLSFGRWPSETRGGYHSGTSPPADLPRVAPARRVLAYAHYDAEGLVRDHVLHALRAMRPVCDDVRFATTARLLPGERARLLPLVGQVLEGENAGFDFSMWRRIIASLDLEAIDELVLMNSSVYGPFRDPGALLGEMDGIACDAWGISESLELDRHLQSYFLVFRRSALRAGAFRAFWDSVLPYRDKRQVIRSYEIGLTSWLAGNGLRLEAVCPWSRLVEHLRARPVEAQPIPERIRGAARAWARLRRRVRRAPRVKKLNPTLAYPGALIDLGSPFLKVATMRDNPYGVDREALEERLRALGYPLANLLPADGRAGPASRPA